jgi:hypothetical protein
VLCLGVRCNLGVFGLGVRTALGLRYHVLRACACVENQASVRTGVPAMERMAGMNAACFARG